MSIGQRLMKVRKSLKVSQVEMAKLLNCSQPNISEYEKDNIGVPISSLIIIRNTYNINLDWLLTGKGEMFLGQTSQTSEFQANNNELEKQQKRLQDLQKQVDLLKKNIQEIDIEYDQEKKRSSDLIHENQKLNRELLTLMRDLIDCKNLVIKLQQK